MNHFNAISTTKELIKDLSNMSLDEDNLYVRAYYLINENQEIFFDFSILETESFSGYSKSIRIYELLYYLEEQLQVLQKIDNQ